MTGSLPKNSSAKKSLLKNALLAYLDEILCGAALLAMISLVTINVFSRYLFNYSISWTEEVATICFVWSVFIGASATYKNKLDMGIDFFVAKVPKRYELVVSITTRCLLLLITGYLFVMSIVFTHIAWDKPTAVLGVSSGVYNCALVMSFGLTSFYTLRFIFRDVLLFKNLRQRGPRL